MQRNIARLFALLSLSIVFLATPSLASAALPSFPGAEGFGAASKGGRGGRVIHVTNLNNAGAGSLRDAVTQTGARTVVFDVGGTITLSSALSMTGGANGTADNSFLTIAGQTAPGGGIQIKGDRILLYQGVHDVIIRYIRHRRGWTPPPGGDTRPGYQVTGDLSKSQPTYNIITDHSSFGWQQDDNCTWSAVHDVTFQWNMFEEPVNPSSDPTDTSEDFYSGKACLVGVDPGDGPLMHNISIHHNLFIHSFERNAAIFGDGPTEFVNNVIYNWFGFGTEMQNRGPVNGSGGGTQVNIIGNNYKAGPNSFGGRYPITLYQADSFPCPNPSGTCSWIEEIPNMIYVLDNITPQRTSGGQPQWDAVGYCGTPSPHCGVNASTSFQRNTPWPGSSTAPITVTSATSNVTPVLNGAGASVPSISGTTQSRDAMDARLVADYNSGASANPSNINNWPTIAGGIAPVDTDGDGIPDAYKTANGLAHNSGPLTAANGYTNLENYLNGVSSSSPLPDLVPTSLSYNSATGLFTSVVKNQGAGPTPSGVYIGNGFYVDGNPVTWGSVLGPLAAGASVTINSSGGGAYTIPSGTHTIKVEADAFGCCGRIQESDKPTTTASDPNNTLSQSITVP